MRRLFAFLALLTGLTAIGATPQASVLSAVAMEVAAAETTQGEKRKQPECRTERKNPASRGDATKDCKETRPVIIYIPTVQFGPDRAFE